MNTHFVGTGRLAADPEVRFTPNGKAICEMRVAFSNSRKKRGSDEYEYTDPIWVSVTLWGLMAENAADTLGGKGAEVVCVGSLELETFEKRDGTKGEKLVLRNAEVAPSIRRQKRGELAAARRSDSRNGSRRSDPHTAHPPQASAQPVDDPWAATGSDQPPF